MSPTSYRTAPPRDAVTYGTPAPRGCQANRREFSIPRADGRPRPTNRRGRRRPTHALRDPDGSAGVASDPGDVSPVRDRGLAGAPWRADGRAPRKLAPRARRGGRAPRAPGGLPPGRRVGRGRRRPGRARSGPPRTGPRFRGTPPARLGAPRRPDLRSRGAGPAGRARGTPIRRRT